MTQKTETKKNSDHPWEKKDQQTKSSTLPNFKPRVTKSRDILGWQILFPSNSLKLYINLDFVHLCIFPEKVSMLSLTSKRSP